MSGESKFAGSVRLYAPFILAFFVFSAVIGAQYLIVQWLITQNHNQEIAEYHGAIIDMNLKLVPLFIVIPWGRSILYRPLEWTTQ